MNPQRAIGLQRRGARFFAVAAVLALAALLALLARGGPQAPAATADPADLALQKSDSPDPVTAGGSLTYTIFVTNNGPDPATNVVVTDQLPGEVTFVSATASNPAGSCKRNGSKITCDVGTVPVNPGVPNPVPTVTILVTVKKNVKAAQISNTASVSSDVADPTPSNNSDTELTRIAKPGGASCRNRPATIVGTGGDDILSGTAGNDVIVAFAGNDTILADAGRDTLRSCEG